jgi:hypothetical protein
MKRSSGITISSIFVFIGSGAMLFFAAIMLFAGFVVGTQAQQPAFMKSMMFAIAAFEAALAAWGVASGIGLLRLKEWARISMIVFSALLLLISLPGLIIILVLPFPIPPNASDAELASHVMLATRIIMSIFYALLISTAGFWLYFFNTRFVRDQFKGVARATAGVGGIPDSGGDAIAAPKSYPVSTRRRPISVSIIGWYLLISAAFVPILFFVRIPMTVLWFVLRGPKATTYAVITAVVQIIIGIGLLKLREWTRILAICYSGFLALSALTTALAPGAQARFEEMQTEIQNSFGVPSTSFGFTPTPMHFPIWFGLAFSLPLIAAALWFLVKSKPAFTSIAEPSASQ